MWEPIIPKTGLISVIVRYLPPFTLRPLRPVSGGRVDSLPCPDTPCPRGLRLLRLSRPSTDPRPPQVLGPKTHTHRVFSGTLSPVVPLFVDSSTRTVFGKRVGSRRGFRVRSIAGKVLWPIRLRENPLLFPCFWTTSVTLGPFTDLSWGLLSHWTQ